MYPKGSSPCPHRELPPLLARKLMALLLWLIAFDCSTLIINCSLQGCLFRLLQSKDWKAVLGWGLLICMGATEPS